MYYIIMCLIWRFIWTRVSGLRLKDQFAAINTKKGLKSGLIFKQLLLNMDNRAANAGFIDII